MCSRHHIGTMAPKICGSQSSPRTVVMAPALLRRMTPRARPMSGKKAIATPRPKHHPLGVPVGERGCRPVVGAEHGLADEEHRDGGDHSDYDECCADEEDFGEKDAAAIRRGREGEANHAVGYSRLEASAPNTEKIMMAKTLPAIEVVIGLKSLLQSPPVLPTATATRAVVATERSTPRATVMCVERSEMSLDHSEESVSRNPAVRGEALVESEVVVINRCRGHFSSPVVSCLGSLWLRQRSRGKLPGIPGYPRSVP